MLTCGNKDDNQLAIISSSYTFSLDQPAPCDGWLFQKITVYSDYKSCDSLFGPCEYHDCDPSNKTAEYWEWFGSGRNGVGLIRKGEKTWGKDLQNSLLRDDKTVKNIDRTCGIHIQVGEVRFYCKKDLVVKNTPNQGEFPWPFGQPVDQSGTLPGSYRVDFWEAENPKSVESATWRWQANWECCCSPGFTSYRASVGSHIPGKTIDVGVGPKLPSTN